MKKRLMTTLLALMIGATTLVGCATNPAKENLEEFDVVLDWYPNGVHTFIYEAIEKGYYEKEGLKVNIQFPSNINDALSLTGAGKAEVGVYYMQDVIMARANQDIPVKSIGSIVQKPLNVVLSLKEKNITSAKDLQGKIVGYAGTQLSEAIIQVMVESSGGSMEDITLIDVGFDLISAMTTGKVDATIGCMANHEVPAMEHEGFAVNYFFPNEYGVPDYYELVFVTGEGQLKEKETQLAGFLRASKKGFDDMKSNPDGALQTLLDNQNTENFPLQETVEKQSIAMLLPMMEGENTPFLSQDSEIWQKNADWLFAQGLIKKGVLAQDVIGEISWQ